MSNCLILLVIIMSVMMSVFYNHKRNCSENNPPIKAPSVLVRMSSTWKWPRSVINCIISITQLKQNPRKVQTKVFLNCFHFNGTRIPKGIKRSTFSTTYAFAFGPPSVSKKFKAYSCAWPWLTLKYGYNNKHYRVANESGAEYRLFVTART